MKVSVIIVNFNTFELSSRCIQSVIEKTKQVDYEIILVDNASHECDAQKFKTLFPQIILVKSSINLGFAGGNNLGLQHATGNYILLLNSDTELINEAISLSINRIASDFSIGALSAQLLYPDGKMQYPASRFPSLKMELRELLRLNKNMPKQKAALYYLGERFDHQTEIFADWIWGTFFLIAKKTIEKFPQQKFPDNFFMYAEDMQWCFLLKHLNYKILYYPSAKVTHHLAASASKTISDEKRFFEKMAPNVLKLLSNERGWLYARLFFFVKMLHLLSLRNIPDSKKAWQYFKLIIGAK